MHIDHIGIVVKSLDDAIKTWERVFGYRQYTEKVLNTRQKVYVVFLAKEGSLPIKLLEPFDKTSPVYKFARRGGGLHHICFKCDNVQHEVERMKMLGFRILTDPEPGEAFGNQNIAFIYAGHGLNIELIDTDEKIKLINIINNNIS